MLLLMLLEQQRSVESSQSAKFCTNQYNIIGRCGLGVSSI